jgi:hypothetical protein
VKALLVFAVSSATEVAQAFGVPLLGGTFDPLDFVMFGLGVVLAVFVDRVVFDRLFPFWSLEKASQPEDERANDISEPNTNETGEHPG